MKLTMDVTRQFYVPDDTDGAYVTIRALSMEEVAEAEASSTELKVDSEQNASMVLDGYKRINAIAKKCIIDWGGFFEANGRQINYSRKNINDMARFVFMLEDGRRVRFFEWVEKCHQELQEEMYSEQEKAEKN